MQLSPATTTFQISELLCFQSDERDCLILLELLNREGVTNTNDLSDIELDILIDEATAIRKTSPSRQ